MWGRRLPIPVRLELTGGQRTRNYGHTQAAFPSETVCGQTIGRHTIAVIANHNDFVFDATRYASHRIPNGGNLLINYRRSALKNRLYTGGMMVYHG